MTAPVCPNYNNCIPGIACTGAEGCLLYKMEMSLKGLAVNQQTHLATHQDVNGDLRMVAEWAHDMVAFRKLFRRWVRPPIVAVGAAIVGTGALAGAVFAWIKLWEQLFGG